MDHPGLASGVDVSDVGGVEGRDGVDLGLVDQEDVHEDDVVNEGDEDARDGGEEEDPEVEDHDQGVVRKASHKGGHKVYHVHDDGVHQMVHCCRTGSLQIQDHPVAKPIGPKGCWPSPWRDCRRFGECCCHFRHQGSLYVESYCWYCCCLLAGGL